MLCGSAFKNKGVQPMLDAVVDYLPSPLDMPPTKGTDPKTDDEIERKASEDEPFSALAFKIVADPYGKLTYFRIYSGKVEKGSEVYNTTKDRQASASAASCACTRTSVRTSKSRTPATSSSASASSRRPPVTRSRIGRTRSCSSAWSSRSRSSTSRSSRRPSRTRTSSARRSAHSPTRTRRSRSAPTKTPARRSSRAWASCTSRCSSTA